MRIHISTAPTRPKPQQGDRKFIRCVEHVRRRERMTTGPARGAYVVSGGRPVFEWIPVSEAPPELLALKGRLIGKDPRLGDANRA